MSSIILVNIRKGEDTKTRGDVYLMEFFPEIPVHDRRSPAIDL